MNSSANAENDAGTWALHTSQSVTLADLTTISKIFTMG